VDWGCVGGGQRGVDGPVSANELRVAIRIARIIRVRGVECVGMSFVRKLEVSTVDFVSGLVWGLVRCGSLGRAG